uniref:Ig-like domain-containing protein n=1 Tax=Anabas testudineus TaxID=64144 RepID=A0A3Q1J7F0_ANATE
QRFCCTPTLIPPELVVRFGESASINCTSSHPDFDIMGWEAPYGGSRYVKSSIVIWEVERLEVWKPDPFCYVTLEKEQCTVHPNITVYKTPDSVSVSASSDEPLVEGREFSLTCDIINVAPKRNLIVKWYRDHEKVHTEMFKNDTSELPNNVTSTWKMIPKKSYNGTKFTCKAELDLGPKGPEPVPTFSINLFIILFPHTHLPEVNQGENVTFSCHAEGNPAPEIHWNYTSAESVWETSGGRQKNITIKATSTNAGVYICVAINEFGKVTRSVTLKIKGMIIDCVMDTFGCVHSEELTYINVYHSVQKNSFISSVREK